MPEIVSLAEDPAWRVRRHAAWNMRLIFKQVGGSERLLDAFLRLTEVSEVSTRLKARCTMECLFLFITFQDAAFRVRRACTETIADMSEALKPAVRAEAMLKVHIGC